MKKIILHLIFFCFLVPLANAQPEESTSAQKSRALPVDAAHSLGYKPAPFRIGFSPRSPGDMRYKSSAAMPARFDLREEGRVTAAKDQGGSTYGGNCTAFSSIGSIESRWLSMGYPETDLSEQNLAACNGFNEENWGYGQGGNQYTCSAYLTRLVGPVSEADDPYNLILHFCRSDIVELDPVALVPESRWLPVRDFELLKRTVYYYGAVYAGIYWDVSGASFRDSDDTYHYSGLELPNHAILVCGWDDSKETAGGTGAWICKNSWGTDWGEQGFFYISYQDSRFAGDEVAYYPERWEADYIDTAYLYDNLGFTAKLEAVRTSKVYELAMFTAPDQQLLTHVGVCVPDPETVLDFHVYDDFDGKQPGNLLGSREDLYIEIPGIYTFELPVTVNGDFYVQVTRETGVIPVNYPVETFDEGFSEPVIEPNVNWVRREGSDIWTPTDVAGYGLDFNLTIRAYARSTAAPQALFKTDKREVCLGSGITFSYLQNNPASSFAWDFGKDASPATADTQGPHTVSYSSEGTKTISLIVSGTGGTDTVIRHDCIDVIPSIRVNILKSTMTFQQGRTVEISAYGADDYEWSPASLVDNATGQTVIVTPPYIGTHKLYVNGTQGSCTSTDSIEFRTTPKPLNDDMCDAQQIFEGANIASVSNGFATPQEDEPAPEDIDCTGPMTWCVDDWGPTVDNSLWYYFYGPLTGVASIITTGFDNQIAIYRADTCTGIIIDSLMAANDDVSANELAARIEDLPVVPGAKYFLQVDGSFGGDTGEFSLFFHGWPVGTEDQEPFDPSAASLSVYPNPGHDIFNIRLDHAESPDIEVILYNLNGQMIMRKSFRGVPGNLITRLDLGRLPAGVYHLRVIDGVRRMDRKLIRN